MKTGLGLSIGFVVLSRQTLFMGMLGGTMVSMFSLVQLLQEDILQERAGGQGRLSSLSSREMPEPADRTDTAGEDRVWPFT